MAAMSQSNSLMTSPGGEESGIFEGRFQAGFEVSWFTPDGSNEIWWVTGALPDLEHPERPSSFRIKCRAKVGPLGRFGHMGLCVREMFVEELMFSEDIAVRKTADLLALAKLRQQTRWDDYKGIGEYDRRYECNFVSPYSRVAHNVDAEIFILLQDWLGDDKLQKTFLPEAAELGYLPNLPTNKVLHRLVRETLDTSMEMTYATNLFPFIKRGSSSSTIPKRLMLRAATTFAIPQIKIVQPRIVVCLGLLTFNAVREASGLEAISPIGMAIDSPFKLGNSKVWCQAHTGSFGQKNRNKGDPTRTQKDWARMAKDLR